MHELTRRRVIEILTVGGLTVTIVLPSRWIRPVVESVIVPAHAQASPVKAALRGTTSTTSTSTTFTTEGGCSTPTVRPLASGTALIYELDERGARVLQERGLPFLPKRYHRNFAHELMVSRIMASIELGALRTEHIRLITWSEILANPKTPLALKDAPRLTAIPVTFTLRGEPHTTEICADGMPFGIERANADGGRLYFFFPGIEADTGTEPVESYDFDRSSIYKKFLAYRAIAEQGIHGSRFGFPNFFVPIITTTDARMRSMMRCLERITEHRGSKMFLFKTFPAFNAYERPPAPTGHMLTDPWHRVGFAPLDFTK